MKNYRQIDSKTATSPYSQIQGLQRVTRGNESFKMSMTVEVSFQTALAASRFRSNFYDLCLKITGNKNSDRQQVLAAAVLTFTQSLVVIRTAKRLPGHAEIAGNLQPFVNPRLTYRVRVVKSACFVLFDCFYHLDTFALSVTNARDTELISSEKATGLIADADTLFDELKRSLLSTKVSLTQ